MVRIIKWLMIIVIGLPVAGVALILLITSFLMTDETSEALRASASPSWIDRARLVRAQVESVEGVSKTDLAVLDDRLDIHIASVLPGEAREVASIICEMNDRKFDMDRPFVVAVYLLINEDTPAARCAIRPAPDTSTAS